MIGACVWFLVAFLNVLGVIATAALIRMARGKSDDDCCMLRLIARIGRWLRKLRADVAHFDSKGTWPDDHN